MNFRCVLRFSLVGFALQVVINVLGTFLGEWSNRLLGDVYWPFVRLGLILDASSEGGGHALQGGGILGYLLGVFVYSVLIGAAICYFKRGSRT